MGFFSISNLLLMFHKSQDMFYKAVIGVLPAATHFDNNEIMSFKGLFRRLLTDTKCVQKVEKQ